MQGPDIRQPPLASGQPAVTRGIARQGCTGCFRQLRGCVILVVALLALVTCALWALSPVFHAPLLVFVNPIPYFRQYTFVVHHGQTYISTLAWSRDGKRIASSSSEQNTIQVWNAASGRTLFSYQAPRGKLSPLAWSPDGTRLALADLAHPLVVLDGTSGKMDFAVAGTGGELSVAWSPDGRQIAAVTPAFDVGVWDAASGQAQATLHDGTAQEVAWSPNGKELASASQDGNVRVWELASGRLLLNNTRKGMFDFASRLAWSPDGRQIAAEVLAMDEVREQVWDVASGRATFSYALAKSRSTQLVAAWSPDSQRLAIGGEIGGAIDIWNVATGIKLLTYGGHQISSFFSSGESNVVVRAGTQALAWSPDGKRIVSLGIEETVQIWDPATASPQFVYDTGADSALAPTNTSYATNGASMVAWSPDGQRVAIAGDNFAEVWRPA